MLDLITDGRCGRRKKSVGGFVLFWKQYVRTFAQVIRAGSRRGFFVICGKIIALRDVEVACVSRG